MWVECNEAACGNISVYFHNAILVQLGSAAGVTVVLDCGGEDADVDPELLKHLTIISPNESELANLTGRHLCALHHLVTCISSTPVAHEYVCLIDTILETCFINDDAGNM